VVSCSLVLLWRRDRLAQPLSSGSASLQGYRDPQLIRFAIAASAT